MGFCSWVFVKQILEPIALTNSHACKSFITVMCALKAMFIASFFEIEHIQLCNKTKLNQNSRKQNIFMVNRIMIFLKQIIYHCWQQQHWQQHVSCIPLVSWSLLLCASEKTRQWQPRLSAMTSWCSIISENFHNFLRNW